MENIIEKIDDYLGEALKIDKGAAREKIFNNKIKSVGGKYDITITFEDGSILIFECHGGAETVFAKGKGKDLIGRKIKKMNVKDYDVEIFLDNGKSVVIEDPTGGEELDMRLRIKK